MNYVETVKMIEAGLNDSAKRDWDINDPQGEICNDCVIMAQREGISAVIDLLNSTVCDTL